MLSQQEVKERCEWVHVNFKERMAKIKRNEYHMNNGGCALNYIKVCNVYVNCKKCNGAKKHNAKLAILLAQF
jgi:hypothetical protein